MLSRMKFEIDELVAEILDQLPSSVWTSNSTTFLDPAIGGGQFVRAVEQRLRSHGHSDENIRTRVFGLEDSDLHIRFAVNKYKLVGNYQKLPYEDFLQLKIETQYDVIVGGPPFQDSSTNKKGNLWTRFIIACNEIVKDNGYIAMITPPSWMSGTDANGNEKKKKIQAIFTENNILYLNLDTGKYFPGIGSHFSSFVLFKNQTQNNPTVVISQGTRNLIPIKGFKVLPKRLNNISFSIVNKFLSYPDKKPFTAKWCVGHPKPEDTEKFKIHNTGTSFASSSVEPLNSKEKKVVVSVSGVLRATYDGGVYGCSINSYWTPVKSKAEGLKYKKAVESNFVQFVFDECKYSGFNNLLLLKSFPAISADSIEEIYQQFQLTQEEINYLNNLN